MFRSLTSDDCEKLQSDIQLENEFIPTNIPTNIDADIAGRLEAINRALAVMELKLDGTIITANENFLSMLGYRLDEIQGQHHSVLVEPEYQDSAEYRAFWSRLNCGKYFSSEYKRIGKDARTVWIQVSYNPIFDADGELCKLVKFASDITDKKELQAMTERAVNDASHIISNISQGNLKETMDGSYSGEFSILRDAVNECVTTLVDIIGEIIKSVALLKSDAGAITAGNASLSQCAGQQDTSQEQASAAIEEIIASVQQNASYSDQANSLARDCRDAAENGGTLVAGAIAAMDTAGKSNQKISGILDIINSIVTQTNVLALNAAVEAARAGENGRGFAIVAKEVSRLGDRSARAAEEIKTMTRDCDEGIQEGSELATISTESIKEISAAVTKVSDRLANISTANHDQATGLDALNNSIGYIDGLARQNTVAAEQAVAESNSLRGHANNLKMLISFFDIDKPGQTGP